MTEGQTDVLTDTEMPDQCMDVQIPQKAPMTLGCTDTPQSPHDI